MSEQVWIGGVSQGSADVIVTLEDGRAYAFTAFTPEGLRTAIDAEGMGCFVCSDLMVLGDITEANVRSAVNEMKITDGLDKYGTPQEAA